MSRYSTIHLRKYKRNRVLELYPDNWVYQRKNWFSDLLWNLLRRLNCLSNFSAVEETVETISIDSTKLTDKILEVMYSLNMNHIKPKHIYIGPDEFEKVLYEGNAEFNNYVDFDVTMGHNRKLFSLPVTVVPHMSGILVV